MQAALTGPGEEDPQRGPGVMKVFLRRLGFVVFGGPLVITGVLFACFGFEYTSLLLVAAVWIATGIAFGRHAASGFSKHTLFTMALAILTLAVTIRVSVYLGDQGSRSVSELVGGGYLFFLFVWAVVAVPLAVGRGLRQLWNSKGRAPHSRTPNVGLPPSDKAKS